MDSQQPPSTPAASREAPLPEGAPALTPLLSTPLPGTPAEAEEFATPEGFVLEAEVGPLATADGSGSLVKQLVAGALATVVARLSQTAAAEDTGAGAGAVAEEDTVAVVKALVASVVARVSQTQEAESLEVAAETPESQAEEVPEAAAAAEAAAEEPVVVVQGAAASEEAVVEEPASRPAAAVPAAPPAVVFYMTTTASTLKLKTEISRVTQILGANGVAYEEVDLSLQPGRREEMVGASGVRLLPQLHCAGRYLGDFDALQELEDAGELGPLLRGELLLD